MNGLTKASLRTILISNTDGDGQLGLIQTRFKTIALMVATKVCGIEPRSKLNPITKHIPNF